MKEFGFNRQIFLSIFLWLELQEWKYFSSFENINMKSVSSELLT